MEAAAALAALHAAATGLGAFLAPHLPALLALLTAPRLLACAAPGVVDAAGRARGALAGGVPPRLLLPPLAAHLGAALQVRRRAPEPCFATP